MRLHATRVVRRPSAEVAEFFFDASNNPAWQSGMRRCEWETPGPIGRGSIYRQEAAFLGRTISSRFVVTDFTPGVSMTIETVESTFPIAVTRRVEPIDDTSCRVSAEISGGPGGIMKALGPITRRLAQRSVDSDYDRLTALFQ